MRITDGLQQGASLAYGRSTMIKPRRGRSGGPTGRPRPAGLAENVPVEEGDRVKRLVLRGGGPLAFEGEVGEETLQLAFAREVMFLIKPPYRGG